MIASLGMYDRPETAASNDAFWSEIKKILGYGPEHLDRNTPAMEIWQSPDLLLSQTCGFPYRSKLHGHVQLVGTPDYGLPNADPGFYNSVLVVRVDDSDDVQNYQSRIFAYNEGLSQSGWAAPQNYALTRGFQFSNIFQSGGHAASVSAIMDGQADIASIDAMTWRLINTTQNLDSVLKVIVTTPQTPGLPYITGLDQDAGQILDAVERAISTLRQEHRGNLGIKGIVAIPAEKYLSVRSPDLP